MLAAPRYASSLASIAPLTIVPYHFLSLRRVFGGSRRATAWKGTLLAVVYTIVILLTMVAVGWRSMGMPDIPRTASVSQRSLKSTVTVITMAIGVPFSSVGVYSH